MKLGDMVQVIYGDFGGDFETCEVIHVTPDGVEVYSDFLKKRVTVSPDGTVTTRNNSH